MKAGNGIFSWVGIPAVTVDDQDVSEACPDKVFQDIVEIFFKNIWPDSDRAREARDALAAEAVIDRWRHERIAFIPYHFGDVAGYEIIGAYGHCTMRLYGSNGQNNSICDFRHNLGQPHPAVILHLVKLQILHPFLGKGRQTKDENKHNSQKDFNLCHAETSFLFSLFILSLSPFFIFILNAFFIIYVAEANRRAIKKVYPGLAKWPLKAWDSDKNFYFPTRFSKRGSPWSAHQER
jgi:voltage-gated potassium channel Kch